MMRARGHQDLAIDVTDTVATAYHEYDGVRFTVAGVPLAADHAAFPSAPPGKQLLLVGTPLGSDDLATVERGLRALVARQRSGVALPGCVLTQRFGVGVVSFALFTATILLVLGEGDDAETTV